MLVGFICIFWCGVVDVRTFLLLIGETLMHIKKIKIKIKLEFGRLEILFQCFRHFVKLCEKI